MKIKNKNVKPNPNLEHRVPLNAFRILCLSFVSFCFLTSPPCARAWSMHLGLTDVLIPYLTQNSQDAEIRMNGRGKPQTGAVETVNFDDEVNKKLPRISTTISGDQSSDPKRQLWRARISVHEVKENNKRKNELRRLIELVRSVEFKPPKQPEPVINIGPAETTVEPNKTPSEVAVMEEHSKKTVESKLPYEPVTDRTLQMLSRVEQDPNQLENPFEMGEVLYFSGHLKQAAVFYQQALNRTDPDKPGLDRNRAWILFQMGNCLKDYDMTKAQNFYRRLIAQYPGSPWVEPAKAMEKLIDWYLKEKPGTLIAESKL